MPPDITLQLSSLGKEGGFLYSGCQLKYLFYIYLPCAAILLGCSHQPQEPATMTADERALACQVGKRDRDLFCGEMSVSRTIRDTKCWEAKRNIRNYCEK